MASSDAKVTNSWASGGLRELTGHARVVTFIGAGGKTTCLRSLTRELIVEGRQVIATTTTKVFPETQMQAWKSEHPPAEQSGSWFWYAKEEETSGKWMGPSVQAVDAALTKEVHWVIEGDGARGLRLKCWESHEPQVPLQSNCVVLVLDRGLWGQVLLKEDVHRPQCCPHLIGRIWNSESAWCYFLNSPVFAAQYRNLAWVILLNGPNSEAEKSEQRSSRYVARDREPLIELTRRWSEIQDGDNILPRPAHLRLAVGDAREGTLTWCDLW